MDNKKIIEPKCKNCLLYDRNKGQCRVAILVNGKNYHMPVFPEDFCHMDQLGIPVQQVRWWQEDKSVKIEYPVGFFGN